MTTFAALHEALGAPETRIAPPADFLASPPANAHPDLQALWKEEGWARYAGGAFWTVDPRAFAGLEDEWPAVPRGAIVFARNAFGDLFLFGGGVVFELLIQRAEVANVSPTVELFLDAGLTEADIREPLLDTPLFEKVAKRLGTLEADECYGLFPPLPLGGDNEKPTSYRKVKLREYLSLVAQAHG